MEQLAPVAAVMSPELPEILREATEVLYLQLVDEAGLEVSESNKLDRLARIALAQVLRLSSVIGGGQVYWPKAIAYHLSPRNRQMCAEFRGDYKVLARKYKLTDTQVRNIVDGWQAERFAARQGTMLGDHATGAATAAKA
jgi:Mor family transcriptional regulator